MFGIDPGLDHLFGNVVCALGIHRHSVHLEIERTSCFIKLLDQLDGLEARADLLRIQQLSIGLQANFKVIQVLFSHFVRPPQSRVVDGKTEHLVLVAFYGRSEKALHPFALGKELDFKGSLFPALYIKMQRQLSLVFHDFIDDDIGALHLGFRPADKLDRFPKAHVLVFRSPVPAMLIRRFARHGIFLRKSWLMLFVERQLSAVVTSKQHFQMVVLRLQQRLHILFPCAELVVGIEELFAVEAHLSVGIDAFKHELHHVFLHDFGVNIEIGRVCPWMVGDPK